VKLDVELKMLELKTSPVPMTHTHTHTHIHTQAVEQAWLHALGLLPSPRSPQPNLACLPPGAHAAAASVQVGFPTTFQTPSRF